jgi:RHS repeat-associated protein
VVLNAQRLATATLRYLPFGEHASQLGDPSWATTDRAFTGQRWQRDIGLYHYGARWYSPALGRFISPDTIVPEPGDPQDLNRYSYAANNPLKLVDLSGRSPQYPGDPDPNNADCATDWCWQNRWYMAHGYGWSGGGWSLGGLGSALFYDAGILAEVLAEAGIAAIGAWDFGELSAVGQGVVDLMNKIGSASRLDELLGPIPVLFQRQTTGIGICAGKAACTYVSLIHFYDVLFDQDDRFVQGTAVHELAHSIDSWSRVTVPGIAGRDNVVFPSLVFPRGTYIGYYAVTEGITEYWAEAVADWVYGGSFKGPYNPNSAINTRNPLSVDQADWIERYLKGWGW